MFIYKCTYIFYKANFSYMFYDIFLGIHILGCILYVEHRGYELCSV